MSIQSLQSVLMNLMQHHLSYVNETVFLDVVQIGIVSVCVSLLVSIFCSDANERTFLFRCSQST